MIDEDAQDNLTMALVYSSLDDITIFADWHIKIVVNAGMIKRLHVCVQHRQLQDVQSYFQLTFSFKITYEQAVAYRKVTGNFVRKNSWKDLTVEVYIILWQKCRWEFSGTFCVLKKVRRSDLMFVNGR